MKQKPVPVFHRPLKSAEAVNEIRVVEGSLKDNDMFVGENLVIDKVTSYFAGRKEKSSHKKDAETMYEKGTGHYKNSWYVEGKVLDDEKKLVFGNDESKYKLFLEACFLE